MAETRSGRRMRKRWLLLLPILALGGWYALSAVTYATSLRLYFIPSSSMSPTLTSGDRICVDTNPRSKPKRGEIWVFTTPSGSLFIKRVVGLPGETIAASAGRVMINGTALDEPYLNGPLTYAMPPVHLAADEYFMLGDNRNASNDSHVWGPVPEREFLGRALYRCWPARRLGELK